MLEAHLTQSSVFRKILDAIKELVTETIFECTKSGISLQAMDNSHVSLVSLKLQPCGFNSYICDKNISLGINLTSLSKIMKCAGNDDFMIIKAHEDHDCVKFTFKSKNHDRISDYHLRLMNLDHEHLGIPDTDYSASIKMPSAEFARICKDLALFGETIEISCSKEGVKFSVSGDLGKGNVKLAMTHGSDGESAVFIDIQEPISVKFAIRYLTSIIKATPLSPRVQISLSVGIPLLIEYSIGEIGHVKYYLAPKLDE